MSTVIVNKLQEHSVGKNILVKDIVDFKTSYDTSVVDKTASYVALGLVNLGDYDSGPLVVDSTNKFFTKDGNHWKASDTLVLPYLTVENWVTDQSKFVRVVDVKLRQDLANIADVAKGSSLVGFLPSGTDAVGRLVQTKLRESISVGDYTTLAAAKTAAVNKVVVDPDGITHKDAFNQSLGVFTEAVDAAWKGGMVHRSSSSGTHAGVSRIAQSVEMRPTGSGDNGPSVADYGSSISVIKQDFFNTTVRGEIDGLNITVRQGGRAVGGISDCAGILLNVGTVHGTGWAGSIEAQTSTFDVTTAAVQLQVQTAMGVLDSSTSSYYGFTTTANVGALGAAYLANDTGSATWTNFLQLFKGGIERFRVSGAGNITLTAPSGPTPSKTIRALGGTLSMLNDAQTVEIFAIGDTGNMTIAGGHGAQNYIANGAATAQGPSTVVYGGTVTSTATAGGAGAPPAQVAGYIICNVAGTQVKVPYYAN